MASPKRNFTAAELVPGRTYTVVRAFQDYDGFLHPTGERWRYLGKSFLPYEDGLTLFVEEEGRNSQIRLQWTEDSQGSIIDAFSSFVEEA